MILRFLAPAAVAALTGCASLPSPIPPAPMVVEVPVTRYVPVPDNLLQPCRWVRDALPSQVFDVAAGRRRCLEIYESDREAIRSIRGGPTPSR